jgi:hypothetical protein
MPVSSTPTLAHQAQAGRDRTEVPLPAGEVVFDQLNPEFGVPADHYDRQGHQAVQDREAALALGTRAAVALRRENEPRPLVRVAGQDDRVAAAVRAARLRRGPERSAPER